VPTGAGASVEEWLPGAAARTLLTPAPARKGRSEGIFGRTATSDHTQPAGAAPLRCHDDPTNLEVPVPSPTVPACPLTVIAWRLAALPVTDLWWRYLELGGNRSRAGLVEYLSGADAWSASEHNTLAQALNECLWDVGHPSLAPYRELPGAQRWAVSSEIEGSADIP
jgi:hypothetical protein